MFSAKEVFKDKDPAGAAKGILNASKYASTPLAKSVARGASLGGALAVNREARAKRKAEEAKNAIVDQRKAEYADKGVA